MKLGSVAENIFAGRKLPAPDGTREAPGTTPLLMVKDVGDQLSPVGDMERSPVPPGADPGLTTLQPGDVVVTSRTAKIRAVVVPEGYAGVAVGPNLVVIRPGKRLLPHVLAGLLRHPTVQAQLLAEFASRTPPGFSVQGISNLEIAVPSIAEQTALRDLTLGAEKYAAAVKEAAQTRMDIAYELIFRKLSNQISDDD